MANDLFKSCIKTNLLVVLSIFLAVGIPIYKFLFTNERELFIPVILPFIDPDTLAGFYINSIHQMFGSIFGLTTVIAAELVMCIAKNSAFATASIIDNAITELKNRLEIDETFTETHNEQFMKIILKILDLNRFDSTASFSLLHDKKFNVKIIPTF